MHFYNDTKLSLKAIGILGIALMLQKDKKATMADLCERATDGIDSIRNGIKELERAGYCEKKICVNENTKKISGSNWVFFEKSKKR